MSGVRKAALPEPQATYADLLLTMRRVARERGYALPVHGSMARDLDVVAVPWIDEAVPVAELLEALRLAVGGYLIEGRPGRDPTKKPHGRLSWTIGIEGRVSLHIDLSVMPRTEKEDHVE